MTVPRALKKLLAAMLCAAIVLCVLCALFFVVFWITATYQMVGAIGIFLLLVFGAFTGAFYDSMKGNP